MKWRQRNVAAAGISAAVKWRSWRRKYQRQRFSHISSVMAALQRLAAAKSVICSLHGGNILAAASKISESYIYGAISLSGV
jgi:hypothetical protein